MAEQLSDTFLDQAAGLEFTVLRTGAELVSLRCLNADGDWTGVLHRDGLTGEPQSGWSNHATVMGYFLHRLVGQQSLYRGKLIQGGNHSFLRHKVFAAPKLLTNGLCYSIKKDHSSASSLAGGYPTITGNARF